MDGLAGFGSERCEALIMASKSVQLLFSCGGYEYSLNANWESTSQTEGLVKR